MGGDCHCELRQSFKISKIRLMSTSHKTIEDYIQLHQRNALTHTVRAAVRLGILQALAERQKTVEQLAAELNLHPQPLQQLMKVLVTTELIEQYGDDYALSAMARLIPAPDLDLGDHYWEHLVNYVRQGSAMELEPCREDSSSPRSLLEEDYFAQKSREEWLLTPLALDAVQILDIGQSRRGLRVLEIGAGSAVFSAALAHRDPDSVINLVDTAAGLAHSRRTIKEIGLERQAELIQVAELTRLAETRALEGQKFDLVLLAGLLHRFDHQQCLALLQQVRQWLHPGRELVILDIFPGQAKGDQTRSLFDLELGLRTRQGQLWDPTLLRQMLGDAGYRQIQYAHLPSAPFCWGLILAESP
jgi:phospholipid N-methyltransferase